MCKPPEVLPSIQTLDMVSCYIWLSSVSRETSYAVTNEYPYILKFRYHFMPDTTVSLVRCAMLLERKRLKCRECNLNCTPAQPDDPDPGAGQEKVSALMGTVEI